MSENKKSNETPNLVISDANLIDQVNKFKGISRFYANDMNEGYISYFQMSENQPDGVDISAVNESSGFDINADVVDYDTALKYCEWMDKFIEKLPDNSSIRFGAFFMMCDLRDFYLSKQK